MDEESVTPGKIVTGEYAFYLSTDNKVDSGDPALESPSHKPLTATILALNIGQTKSVKFSYKAPAGTTAQQLTGKFISGKLDAGNAIAELNENNNNAAGGPLAP